MIDVTSPETIDFSQAAEMLPRDHRGRRTSLRTLKRWATKGAHGVVLEAARLGRRWFTTPSAIREFSITLASVESPIRTSTRTQERAEAECQLLEAMGL